MLLQPVCVFVFMLCIDVEGIFKLALILLSGFKQIAKFCSTLLCSLHILTSQLKLVVLSVQTIHTIYRVQSRTED
jgi:hypothetical protein